MSKKLFVGGLPFDYSDELLRELFAPLGKVLSAIMVQDPVQGRTRGFGFVAMSTPEETQAAIKALNGTTVGTKAIYVAEAREKSPKQNAASAPDREKTHWDKWQPKTGKPSAEGPAGSTSEAPRKPFGRGPFPFDYKKEGRGPSRDRGRGAAPYRDKKRGSFPYTPRGEGAGPRSGFGPPKDRSRGPSPYSPRGEGTGSASFRDRKRSPFPYNNKNEGPGTRDKPPRASDFRPSSSKPSKKPFWNKFKKDKPD